MYREHKGRGDVGFYLKESFEYLNIIFFYQFNHWKSLAGNKNHKQEQWLSCWSDMLAKSREESKGSVDGKNW